MSTLLNRTIQRSFFKAKRSKNLVLIVEDEIVDQMAIKRAVKENVIDFEVVIAASVREALDHVVKRKFDAIITDYHLGDGTAMDILSAVIGIPVLFVTGMGDEDLAIQVIERGASDFIVKDQQYNYLKLLPLSVSKAIAHFNSQSLLEESERRYRELFETTSDLIFSIDSEGNILFVNQAWKEKLGYKNDEIIHLNIYEVIHEELKEYSQTVFSNLAQIGTSIPYKAAFMSKAGEKIYLEGNVFSFMENGLIAARAILHDISPQMKIQQHLKKSNQELEQQVQNRMRQMERLNKYLMEDTEKRRQVEQELKEYKNELVQLINGRHEIVHNGVEKVKLAIQKLEESHQSSIKEGALIVKTQINRLQRLSEEISNTVKIIQNHDEMVALDLKEVLRNCLTDMEDDNRLKELQILTDFDPNVRLKGNPFLLGLLFRNVITNALCFRNKDQQATLRIRSTDGEHATHLEFEDNGIGIKPEFIPKATQMFSRQFRNSGNMGLGLYQLKLIMKKLQGSLNIESESGRCTLVRLTFPKG